MKKVCVRSLLFSFCLLLAGAAGALATDTPPAMQGDANKDGFMTCSEAKAFASERFTKMDANKNKSLSMNEMEEAMTSTHKEMDTDKDGLVNVEEMVTYWCGAAPKGKKAAARGNKQPQFRKMDKNNDGKLSVDECVAVWTVRFADADANKDGKVTKQEYVQSLIYWFADTDANRDSAITVSEWTNYWVGKCQAEKMKKSLSKK
jgi:Ca2+-binding EF-hand superfamily protein